MRDQAWLTHLFGGLIVQADPRPQALAFMPTGIIPDDNDHTFTFLPGYRQQRDNKHPGLLTIGLPNAEGQTNLVCILSHGAKAGQRFLRFIVLGFAHHQPERFTRQCPSR
jgi:hypothetical protein